MRECKMCGLKALDMAQLTAFVPHRKALFGYENKCKSCKSIEYLNWRSKNFGYRSSYHLKNKEKENKNSLTWLKNNPAKVAEITRKYQVAKFSHIPPWYNANEVSQIYAEAKRLGLEVDHIVPLQGKNVCGLHVQNNLQCISLWENRSKSNKLVDQNCGKERHEKS
jgi:hypothetical protein